MYVLWLIICYISFVFLGASSTLVSSIWPTIAKSINVLETNLGIFMGVYLVVNVLFLTLSSKIVEKLGVRVTISFGIILLGIGTLIMSFAINFTVCIVAAIILGVGTGITDTTTDYYVAEYYKARYLAWLHCFWGFGSMIGPIALVGLLSLGLTYKNSYLVIAPIFILFSILILVIKKIDDKKRHEVKLNIKNGVSERPKVDYKKIFTTKKSTIFFIMMFFSDFLMNSVSVWISTYLIVVHSVDTNRAAAMVSVYFVGVTLTRFVSGIAAEKMGYIKIMAISVTVYILASISMIFVGGNMNIIPILVFLLGVGAAPQYPLCIGYSKEIFTKDQLNGVIGLAGSTAQFGSWVASVLIGFLGGIFTLNVFTYVVAIAGVLAIFVLRRLAMR